MATIYNQPIPSVKFENAEDFRINNSGTYIYNSTNEDRSSHIDSWKDENLHLSLIEIVSEKATSFIFDHDDGEIEISLRSEVQISSFFEDYCEERIYIDITGLSRHIWPSLLKIAFKLNIDVYVAYVEPNEYKKSTAPTEGQIYDLSNNIEGISPIPGFTSLAERDSENTIFIPLLGFEGTRLAYIFEQVQPPNEQIVPVIGVPGFKLEYPFETYLGNKRILTETGAWKRAKFASANCPFDVFYLLQKLSTYYSNKCFDLAIIGTKPQALGAILFSIITDHPTEIFYDHPIKKTGRTSGLDYLHLYHVSALNR